MAQITISQEEYDFCVMVAATRNMVARANNVSDRQMGGQSALETDLVGIVGEYAFCKLNNIFPDLVAAPRSGSYDCLLKGYRVDVKSTRYRDGKLLATTKENADVDRYVLAIVDGRSVTFPGWASKDQFICEGNLRDLGHGVGYVMEQSRLNAWGSETGRGRYGD